MTVDVVQKEVETYFQIQWADLTPIAFENVSFDQTENKAWVRLTIAHGRERQGSMGAAANAFRNTGVIGVQCFLPLREGTAEYLNLVAKVMEIFRAKSIGSLPVVTRDMRPDVVGENQGWYQANVYIDFYWDAFF